MSETSPVPSPQRPKPTKAREEAPPTSRIPVKQRPAQPPLHVRASQTRGEVVFSGHAQPMRRGRSHSINPSFTTTAKQPTQPIKRAGTDSSQPSPAPLPQPSLSQSLTCNSRSQPPAPSPPLTQRSVQGVPAPSQISRPPQGGSVLPSTHIPRAVPANIYKRAQSVATTSHTVTETARLRMIERATKARLYLLHQIGPNRFLIGGDSLDSRFHVTIGPQNCTCGKQHCIHLLFVMLRVLKVSPADLLLWSKQLRNYEAESLLNDLHARNSQRTTPKKINKRRFDFTVQKMHTAGSLGGLSPLVKTGSDDREDGAVKTEDGSCAAEGGRGPQVEEFAGKKQCGEGEEGEGVSEGVGESGEGERGDSDKSEEEDVCPICLNELDEGEDLIACRRCGNRLHQHCMDIWAGEQIRKKEVVHCPVCRSTWRYSSHSPIQASGSQTFLQVSIPVEGEGGSVERGGLRLKSLSPSQQMQLSGERVLMVDKIRKVFGVVVVDGILSSDWKSREMAITHTSREVIALLLPKIKVTTPASVLASSNWREVQEASFLVVLNGCSDSVLKVFLASLELLRVVLGYSVCSTEEDSVFLQSLLQPLLLTLLTRCADAQSRVKECCIDTICHFCLGQEGPLSLGSACGQISPFCVSSLPFIMRCALRKENHGLESSHSWHWWLGRLNIFERIIQRFSWDFLLANCIQRVPFSPPSPDVEDSLTSMSSMRSLEAPPSSLECWSDDETRPDHQTNTSREASPKAAHGPHLLPPPPPFPARSPSLQSTSQANHPSAETNLLAQAWYFAAQATHVPHHKVGKVARRVIIRIAKVLRNEASSLEILHDVVLKCHRTQAEGLLDRVLTAREKPSTESRQLRVEFLGAEKKTKVVEQAERRDKEERPEVNGQVTSQPYTPFPEMVKEKREVKETASADDKAVASSEKKGVGTLERRRMSEYGSDDSYRSAVSDLSGEEREGDSEKQRGGKQNGAEAQTSSETSTDSRSDDQPSKSDGTGVDVVGLPKYYQRQTTADSVFSNSSTDQETSVSGPYQCKRNIEEEEAAAEAKVRSMLPEDAPHPSLYGIQPPNPEVLIYVQASGAAEGTDGTGGTYMEGKHWVKGKLIGTGAFCSCFIARDTRLGTMMAVKQVSYVRNTKTDEEEELKRLQEEVTMLGRLSHPNIVRCLGATQHEGHINIFIEWMAGGCLDQVLHDFGLFAESVICNYTRQIVYGIVYLHEHGIIHRDLKGGNILLDSTGQRIRIADFGAAARLASHTTGQGEFQDMEGTVAFMAPEVVRGGTTEEGSATGYGRKCDVWSIGCVIIQMASAKPPWAGTYDVKNKFQLIFKIGQATEPPPMPYFSDPALKDLTLRCLEVNPDERPVSTDLLKHPLFTSS